MEGTWVPSFIAYMTEERVRSVVESALEAQQAFLVEMNISSSGKIMVYADKDDGIGIGDLKMINRAIEAALDEETQDFAIEVSSPGMGNPFRVHRQFVKNRGRDVKVRMADGTEHMGTMIDVREDGITLEQSKRVPKETGKGKVTVTERLDLMMDQIAETKLEFKF